MSMTATRPMQRASVVRWILVSCCAVSMTVSGCARLNWSKSGKDREVFEDEAKFVASGPPPKKLPPPAETTPPPAAAAAEKSPPQITQPQAAPTPDRAALIADTLARLKSLPDVTPAQYAEFEKSLAQPASEMPTLHIQQLNAVAKFRQQEAAAKPPTLPTAQPVAAPAQPASEVVQAVAEEPAEPAEVAPQPSLAERLKKTKQSQSQPSGKGIFGGKVQTGESSSSSDSTSSPHTTHKPASADAVTSSSSEIDSAEEEPAPERALTWQEHLAKSIEELQTELQAADLPEEDRQRGEVRLRMLLLLAERRDEALSAIEGLDAAQQDYWRSQLCGLHVNLAADGTPVKGRRATLALRNLREAVDHLATQATLDVRNVALCSEVTIWGNYQEFSKYEFKPDQEVLLYFEVENFTAEETSKGFATEFVSSYEIFDAAGRRVAEQQFPVAHETCRNRRHDYFIRYHMHVPKQLTSGDYTLQLTVEDQKGHKFGQGSLKFKVL